jgi:hypothetical protein
VTPLRAQRGEAAASAASSVMSAASAAGYTPRTTITARAMRRAGFLVDSGDSAESSSSSQSSSSPPPPPPRAPDARAGDDEFERQFYLGEDGGQSALENRGEAAFLGSAQKFQAREEQMSQARAAGRGVAGDVKVLIFNNLLIFYNCAGTMM